MFHWLSGDIVRFKIKVAVAVCREMYNDVTLNVRKMAIPAARRVEDDAIIIG